MSVATKKKAQLKHPYIEKKAGVCGGEPVIIGSRGIPCTYGGFETFAVRLAVEFDLRIDEKN